MAAYTPTNNQYVFTGDIVLTGSDTIDFIGAAGARVTVIGNGFRIYCPDASFTGHIKMDYCDIFDLGSAIKDCIAGTNLGDYFFLGSAAYVDIQHTTFQRGGGFNFLCGGTSYIKFNYNTFFNTNKVPTLPDDATNSRAFFTEQGSSTTTKEMKGNLLFQSWAYLGSPNWVVGAASGATSAEKDADGNICFGERVGFNIQGSGSYCSYNYSHVKLDVSNDRQTTSQNYNMQGLAAGSTAEHNVFHSAHWVANGIYGTLQKNVLFELSPHNFARIGTGIVKQNIFSTLYPGLDRYTDSVRMESGDSAFGCFQAGDNLTIDHNTVDCRGHAIKDGCWVVIGARFAAVKNTIFYKLTTKNSGGADVTSAIGLSDTEGYPGLGSEPNRADYLDYNNVLFAPDSLHNVVYAIKADSLSLGNSGWGGHDLGTLNGQGLDPQFKGPLTIGSGQTGTGGNPVADSSNFDSGFPFNDTDIISRKITVQQLLSYFRWIYAPNNVNFIGSASDGDNRGAVLAADIPGAAPSIVTTNKKPMVYAGPSMSVLLASGVKLGGYGADDALPSVILTFSWTKVSGPGNVTFADSTKANTTATFSATGVYVLRLTAYDGSYYMRNDCTITVT